MSEYAWLLELRHSFLPLAQFLSLFHGLFNLECELCKDRVYNFSLHYRHNLTEAKREVIIPLELDDMDSNAVINYLLRPVRKITLSSILSTPSHV